MAPAISVSTRGGASAAGRPCAGRWASRSRAEIARDFGAAGVLGSGRRAGPRRRIRPRGRRGCSAPDSCSNGQRPTQIVRPSASSLVRQATEPSASSGASPARTFGSPSRAAGSTVTVISRASACPFAVRGGGLLAELPPRAQPLDQPGRRLAQRPLEPVASCRRGGPPGRRGSPCRRRRPRPRSPASARRRSWPAGARRRPRAGRSACRGPAPSGPARRSRRRGPRRGPRPGRASGPPAAASCPGRPAP